MRADSSSTSGGVRFVLFCCLKIALAAAVGAGVLVGAGGLIVYQRLNKVSPVLLVKYCLGCCAGGGLIVYQRLNQVRPVLLGKYCLGCHVGGEWINCLPAAESG